MSLHFWIDYAGAANCDWLKSQQKTSDTIANLDCDQPYQLFLQIKRHFPDWGGAVAFSGELLQARRSGSTSRDKVDQQSLRCKTKQILFQIKRLRPALQQRRDQNWPVRAIRGRARWLRKARVTCRRDECVCVGLSESHICYLLERCTLESKATNNWPASEYVNLFR
jgi:hypothetical protein